MDVSKALHIKTLPVSAQKKSILKANQIKKGKSSNNRKEVLKTYLDNPFKLDWPPLHYNYYTRLTALLNESLNGFNLKEIHPLPTSFQHLSKKDRKAYKDSLKNDTSISSKMQYRSNLIVGYNSVMRCLEKKQISCIFVNIETKPNFAERLFLPLCSVQSIPLIPLKGFSDIVCKKECLGIKSCRALGLRIGATINDSPFYKLYSLACEAIGVEKKNYLSDMENNKSSSEQTNTNKMLEKPLKRRALTNSPMTSKDVLTKDQIASLHLRRSNKLTRIFKPGIKTEDSVSHLSSDSFISFSTPSVNTSDKRKYINAEEKKEALSHDASLLASEMFSIDHVPALEENSSSTVQNNDTQVSQKSKRPLSYIPTQVKRIKRNPNRKGKSVL